MDDALQKVRCMLAAKYPEELQMLKDQGKTNPYGSLAFFVYADYERKALRKMMTACGQQAISSEHDGIGGQGDRQSLLRWCTEAVAPLRVAIKEYPSDPLEKFRFKFPEFDWSVKSDISIKEYAGLVMKCRSYIEQDA